MPRQRRGRDGEERGGCGRDQPFRPRPAAAGPPAQGARLPYLPAPDLGRFAGRDVTVIGSGQSALETAALAHEESANVRVLVRQPRLVWNADPDNWPRPLARRVRYPMTGLGPGWRSYIYCNAPRVFHRLPERTRVRTVNTALGRPDPGG